MQARSVEILTQLPSPDPQAAVPSEGSTKWWTADARSRVRERQAGTGSMSMRRPSASM